MTDQHSHDYVYGDKNVPNMQEERGLNNGKDNTSTGCVMET